MITATVENALNLLGITAFAFSGALLGVRRQFDVVGMTVLATVTALGGGMIRDVLLDAPPTALQNPWWLGLPLFATLITFRWHGQVRRLHRAVQLLDAIGLGVFCATATVKALDYGQSGFAAVLLGTITGIGGGMIRDVLAGVVPAVLRKDSRLYALPAIAGCAIVAVASAFGPVTVAVQVVAASVICLFRVLALWRGWTLPVPRLYDSNS